MVWRACVNATGSGAATGTVSVAAAFKLIRGAMGPRRSNGASLPLPLPLPLPLLVLEADVPAPYVLVILIAAVHEAFRRLSRGTGFVALDRLAASFKSETHPEVR